MSIHRDLSDEDREFHKTLNNAIKEAFETSRRWLAVCSDPDGNIMRYGPFESRESGAFEARQVFDYDIEMVEMCDWAAFNARMSRMHVELAEKRKYRAALAASIVDEHT